MIVPYSSLTNCSASGAEMRTMKHFALVLACLRSTLAQEATLALGPSTFIAPGAFPTSAFSKYFNSPTATSAQVQPVISDPVLVC